MSYIEKHLLFSVGGYEEPWKIQFLNPFNGEEKKAVTAYVLAPNSHYSQSTYKGLSVLTPGPLLKKVMQELIPRIQSYPYEWEWSGKKIYRFGYDFETDMASPEETPTVIELTSVAYRIVADFYEFDKTIVEDIIVNSEDKITCEGAAFKLEIELQRAQWISELSLDYFSDFPMKLISLVYQKDTNPYSTVYEIPLDSIVVNRQTECLLFPRVFVKRLFLIIQQENYTPIVHVPVYENVTESHTEYRERTYQNTWDEYIPEEYYYETPTTTPAPTPVPVPTQPTIPVPTPPWPISHPEPGGGVGGGIVHPGYAEW
jgi:hypothetical protein